MTITKERLEFLERFKHRCTFEEQLELVQIALATSKDAERYRWLKANHLQTGADSWIRTGDDLEEAIDAAMASQATPQPERE